MIASLPMYDWPEIRTSTDLYWKALADSFDDHGVFAGAPQTLTRGTDPHSDWLNPELLLSQTCGLPFVRELQDKVVLVGAPAYAIECGPGSYFSVIIANEKGDIPLSLVEGRLAYNDKRSQSGFAAFFQFLQDKGIEGCPSELIQSTSHRKSIQMVANGDADFAAIDAVSYQLALRHEATAAKTRVVGYSTPTPGLPYIASFAFLEKLPEMQLAIIEGMASLPEDVRNDLLLLGFVRRNAGEYDIVRSRFAGLLEKEWFEKLLMA